MFLGIGATFLACFTFSGHVKNVNNVNLPNANERMQYQYIYDSNGIFYGTSDYLFVESYSFTKTQILNDNTYKFYIRNDGNDYFYFMMNNFSIVESTNDNDVSFTLTQNQLGHSLRERFNFDIDVYASYGASSFDDSDIDYVHSYFKFFSNANVPQHLNFQLLGISDSWLEEQTLNISFVYHVYNQTVYDLYDVLDTYDNGYSDGYDNGYGYGYNEGYDNGLIEGQQNYIESDAYENAIDTANQSGYNRGYNDGINTQTYTFHQLFGAIADTPIMIMYNLLGFDVFGVSALSIVMTMLTGCIVLFLLKRIVL